MADKTQNYRLFVQHAPSDRAPDGITLRKSFLHPDTAISWARDAHGHGAAVAYVIRKSDGIMIFDAVAGYKLDHREW